MMMLLESCLLTVVKEYFGCSAHVTNFVELMAANDVGVSVVGRRRSAVIQWRLGLDWRRVSYRWQVDFRSLSVGLNHLLMAF